MKKVAPVTCVIFDMDGLLLDTEPIYTKVTQKIAARFGKTFDWRIKRDMVGRPQMDSALHLVNALALPITAEQYLAERNDMLRAEFAGCGALPGAESLVRHLRSHNIPTAVATSSEREMFELKITRHRDWFNLMDAVVCGDDPQVKQGKPAPDIFLAAAARLNADPKTALAFEDSPAGITAATAAGMQTIAVPDPNMNPKTFPPATETIPSLHNFKPERYCLPTYD